VFALKAQAKRTSQAPVAPAVKDESTPAWIQFQRIALGQTNLAGLPSSPGPGGREDISLVDWITQRMQNVAAELDGSRKGRLLRRSAAAVMSASHYRASVLPKTCR
jgi:hypothetical protein